MMSLDEVRSMPAIYRAGSGHFSFDYYFDSDHPLVIFLEFDIMCEAKYLIRYELKENGGLFFIIVSESVSTIDGSSESEPECLVAGYEREESIRCLIGKIIAFPAGNIRNSGVDIKALQESLRKVLLTE